jgi:hypothetical protein
MAVASDGGGQAGGLASPIPRKGPSPWKVVGIVLAIAVAVAGLVVLAGVILVIVSLNQWGSNK